MFLERPIVLTVAIAIAAAGCATSSKDIPASYVSPLQYQSYDCEQLGAEAQRIQSRVVQLGGRLDEAASNDKALMGVGLVLFWPVLFALGGTKQQEAEYARLRGEYDAVQQAALDRKCAAAGPGQASAASGARSSATAAAETAPGATPGAPGPGAIGAFTIGDRLDYRLHDPISNAVIAEQTFVITRVGDGQIEYDNGDLVTDAAGNWVSGRAGTLKLLGIFRPSYGAGAWKGRIESAADSSAYAEVDVRHAGPLEFTARGVQLTAVKLALSGYASPSGLGRLVHQLRGEALVDAGSGVLLQLKIDTPHPALGTRRTLVARIRAN